MCFYPEIRSLIWTAFCWGSTLHLPTSKNKEVVNFALFSMCIAREAGHFLRYERLQSWFLKLQLHRNSNFPLQEVRGSWTWWSFAASKTQLLSSLMLPYLENALFFVLLPVWQEVIREVMHLKIDQAKCRIWFHDENIWIYMKKSEQKLNFPIFAQKMGLKNLVFGATSCQNRK